MKNIIVQIVGENFKDESGNLVSNKCRGEVCVTCSNYSERFYWLSEKKEYKENFSIQFFEEGQVICDFDNSEENNDMKNALLLFCPIIEEMSGYGLSDLLNEQYDIKKMLHSSFIVEPQKMRTFYYKVNESFFEALFLSTKINELQD